ncbi:hypothetical protein CEXT_491401 [Caerostris extrusa]|uniref:Uncharacterized protein n=1 Tax=Caerostris extrusa TaxID=172846 RepID=A0AAV4SZ91_CAEEX|nr:hypothetical protein CEXT_491401 [Caerostris extrusa]
MSRTVTIFAWLNMIACFVPIYTEDHYRRGEIGNGETWLLPLRKNSRQGLASFSIIAKGGLEIKNTKSSRTTARSGKGAILFMSFLLICNFGYIFGNLGDSFFQRFDKTLNKDNEVIRKEVFQMLKRTAFTAQSLISKNHHQTESPQLVTAGRVSSPHPSQSKKAHSFEARRARRFTKIARRPDPEWGRVVRRIPLGLPDACDVDDLPPSKDLWAPSVKNRERFSLQR